MLVDSRTTSKAFTAVEHEYGMTGDAVAVGKITKLIINEATAVLARTGLGSPKDHAKALLIYHMLDIEHCSYRS